MPGNETRSERGMQGFLKEEKITHGKFRSDKYVDTTPGPPPKCLKNETAKGAVLIS